MTTHKKIVPAILIAAGALLGLVVICCLGSVVAQQVGLLPTLTPKASSAQPPFGIVTPTPVPTETAALAPTGTLTITSTPAPTGTPTATPLPTNTPAPTATPAPAEVLAAAARKSFGDRLISAELNDVAGKMVATIDYDQGAQWDENSAVESAVYELIVLAPEVFSLKTVDVFELRAFADFTDVLGNTKKDVSIKFTLSRALAGKVNWKGIDMHRIGLALATDDASGVYIHPALQKAWIKFNGE